MERLTPWQRYQADLKQENFSYDAAQEAAVKALQRLYDQMLLLQKQQQSIFFKLKKSLELSKPTMLKGLYLWGGVGRGKTYLMDMFFETLPLENKLRVHFHHFMLMVHQELNTLKSTADPLPKIAAKMAKQYQVICFDEFFVTDITDAMLLGTLFAALFKEGVVLVATSNIVPDDLYRNGLQRARFLPAIALIKQHCEVLNLDSGIDYRLRTLEQAEIYHFPLDEQANINLLKYFEQLTVNTDISTEPLRINDRQLVIQQQAKGVLLINFRDLCDGPRSQRDYIILAQRYHTVLLSDLEQMGAQQTGDDIARRFLALVDEFYERHVKLIISAQVPVEHLYTQGQLEFEFHRCRSRLIEMQSYEYLALEHLP